MRTSHESSTRVTNCGSIDHKQFFTWQYPHAPVCTKSKRCKADLEDTDSIVWTKSFEALIVSKEKYTINIEPVHRRTLGLVYMPDSEEALLFKLKSGSLLIL